MILIELDQIWMTGHFNMKDELVSFEVATLALEKGFNYMEANCYGDNMCYQLPEGKLINALNGNTVSGYILAPTQSLLQRWLRENHNIVVSIHPISDGFTCEIDTPNKHGMYRSHKSMVYRVHVPNPDWTGDGNYIHKTWEIALEEGLKYALKITEI